MSLPLALENYVKDLGLVITDQPNLEFVALLQARHIEKYSFNSLAVVMGEEISLELEAIYQKIVVSGLGGYCFEHNKLTFELLKQLGYDVTLVMARVLNNQEFDAPRTHRVTLLTLGGVRYLVDTGFGGHCPITPLRLGLSEQPSEFNSSELQAAGHDQYRILSKGKGEYDLQMLQDEGFYTLYRFDLACYSDADCVLGNFYSSQYPKAGFVNNLMVSLKNVQRTVVLKNHLLKVKSPANKQETIIDSPEELGRILADVFGFDLDFVVVEHLFERFLAEQVTSMSVSAGREL